MKVYIITFVILTAIVLACDIFAYFIMSSQISIARDMLVSLAVCIGIFIYDKTKHKKR